jgi:hypothetical protein
VVHDGCGHVEHRVAVRVLPVATVMIWWLLIDAGFAGVFAGLLLETLRK